MGEVVDFMPVSGTVATADRRLIRMIRCVRGEMAFVADVAPRFDYGREPHETRLLPDGAYFEGRATSMAVSAVREPGDERLATVTVDGDGDVRAEFRLSAGESRGLVLETGPGAVVRPTAWPRSGACSRRPWTSGGRGLPARPTRDVGGR